MKGLMILFIWLWSGLVMAQEINPKEEDYSNMEVEMADGLRSDGKIYVVVTISSVVLLGMLGFAFYLDRRISTLEAKLKAENDGRKSNRIE